jgi:hypothetical protein
MAIWQDLVDQHGFPARYASVAALRGAAARAASARGAPGDRHGAGQEAQVDYGDGPMVLHAVTGKYRRRRLFVLTLGYNRKSVRLLTVASSARRWAELHEEAFRRLGGAVRVVVLDNLKEGVLIRSTATSSPTYGAIALPCCVHDAGRKGKVESAVGHTQRTPLKGLRFERLDEAQAYLDRWETRWADTRIHGTTKRQVATMFAEERRLNSCRCRSSPFATTSTARAPCISMAASKSLVPTTTPPPGWLGRWSPCNGTTIRSRCPIPPPAPCSASIVANRAVAIHPALR